MELKSLKLKDLKDTSDGTWVEYTRAKECGQSAPRAHLKSSSIKLGHGALQKKSILGELQWNTLITIMLGPKNLVVLSM